MYCYNNVFLLIFIISFSSFEVIVLLLGVKVMTFVLCPMLRCQEIVNDWNAIKSSALSLNTGMVLCD